jgi:hypothetical protein
LHQPPGADPAVFNEAASVNIWLCAVPQVGVEQACTTQFNVPLSEVSAWNESQSFKVEDCCPAETTLILGFGSQYPVAPVGNGAFEAVTK